MNKQVSQDIQQILDESNIYAEDFLTQFGEFYPFAFSIEKNGLIRTIAYQDEKTEMPKSKKVIAAFRKTLDEELQSGEIRSYGIVYDVRVDIDEKGTKSDAIAIEIFHKNEIDIPIYYFPYKIMKKGSIKFTESFAIHR